MIAHIALHASLCCQVYLTGKTLTSTAASAGGGAEQPVSVVESVSIILGKSPSALLGDQVTHDQLYNVTAAVCYRLLLQNYHSKPSHFGLVFVKHVNITLK